VPLLSVESPVHHVTRIGQRGRELTIEIGVVLDHQKTQENSLLEAQTCPPARRIAIGDYLAIT
jgi:hypothetical protein